MKFKDFYINRYLKESDEYNTANFSSSSSEDINDNEDFDMVYDRLKANGWKEIGSGSFAKVFEHPEKDYVMKLFTDQCYLAFLRFLERHQNNPHIVKVKSIDIIPKGDNVGLVAIEKLKKANFSNWRNNLALSFGGYLSSTTIGNRSLETVVDGFMNKVKKDENSMKQYYVVKNQDTPEKDFRQKISHHDRLLRRVEFFIEDNLPLARALYELSKYLEMNSNFCRFDLHSGNFMIRPSTGEIVITDPVS